MQWLEHLLLLQNLHGSVLRTYIVAYHQLNLGFQGTRYPLLTSLGISHAYDTYTCMQAKHSCISNRIINLYIKILLQNLFLKVHVYSKNVSGSLNGMTKNVPLHHSSSHPFFKDKHSYEFIMLIANNVCIQKHVNVVFSYRSYHVFSDITSYIYICLILQPFITGM